MGKPKKKATHHGATYSFEKYLTTAEVNRSEEGMRKLLNHERRKRRVAAVLRMSELVTEIEKWYQKEIGKKNAVHPADWRTKDGVFKHSAESREAFVSIQREKSRLLKPIEERYETDLAGIEAWYLEETLKLEAAADSARDGYSDATEIKQDEPRKRSEKSHHKD